MAFDWSDIVRRHGSSRDAPTMMFLRSVCVVLVVLMQGSSVASTQAVAPGIE
jgi:hypothetical protein